MKIDEGMYVRTECGIDRFKYRYKEGDKPFFYYQFEKTRMTNPEYYVIGEPSHKIEDLLQIGDYVNGYMITDFDDDYYDEELDEDVEGFSIVLGNEEQLFRIPPKDIKTVLTKEQMEAMQYKVV